MTNELAFVDVETTGLNPKVHKLWSIGIITENAPEFYAEFPVVLDKYTELKALEVNRYVNVMADNNSGEWAWLHHARRIEALLKNKTLVGAAVHFDAKFIKRYLDDAWHHYNISDSDIPPTEPWHYKLLDVCTLTMGTLGLNYIPSLSECCELLSIEVDDSRKHNALYDAQLAQDVYNRCNLIAHERGPVDPTKSTGPL